ncbi:MAG: nitroreductase family protein [Oscillospiraceae bacterium]|nr:nitroreductase family protein [Oscillospiraceae bacterium]
MNDTQKSIMERFSCRGFSSNPVSDEKVKAIVDAALAAPSAMNQMPWFISVITDKSFIDELDAEGMSILAEGEDKSSYNRMMERGGKLFYNAPLMIVIAGNDSGASPLDCGILTQNIALSAHALNLGNVICGMAGVPLTGRRAAEFKKRMSIPDEYNYTMSVLIGEAVVTKEPHELDYSKVSYVK